MIGYNASPGGEACFSTPAHTRPRTETALTRKRTKPRRRKRLLTPARKRAIAQRMTWAVIALQAALLLTLAVTPGDPPQGSRLGQLIWAWMHKPTFYPLVALLGAGPPLTWLACRTPGRHRPALLLAWFAFGFVIFTVFGQRTLVMLRILWWQMNG